MLSKEEITNWYDGKKIENIKFTIDSPTKIIKDTHIGEIVALIFIESTSPIVTYLAENTKGDSFIVDEGNLEEYIT